MASSRGAVAAGAVGYEDSWEARKVRVEIGGERGNRGREPVDFHWSELKQGLASKIVVH